MSDIEAKLRYRVGNPSAWSAYDEGASELMREAADLIAALRAKLEVMGEALEPFAEAAFVYDPPEGDDADIAWSHDFPIGALRRARTTLASIKGGAE